jgi:hypothetical protein
MSNFALKEKHSKKSIHTEISPLRSPDFLSRSVALIKFIRFPLRETAPLVLAGSAMQEIRCAPVEMTEGRQRFQGE